MNKTQDSVSKHRQALENIPADSTKRPRVPVAIALSEAEALHVWVQSDRSILERAGLDWGIVQDLPQQTALLREAQALWENERLQKTPDEEAAGRTKKDAQAFIRNLKRALKYCVTALGDTVDKAVLKSLNPYCRAQKLIATAHIGAAIAREHETSLRKIGFDFSFVDKLGPKDSTVLHDLADQWIDSSIDDGQARTFRDRAYTYLSESVESIRRCGRYAFHDNPARRAGYVSSHVKSWRAKRTGK